MFTLTLLRTASVPSGLYGMLFLGNVPMCLTLEPNWLNNARNVSCIPPGTYECIKYSGTRFKNVFLLKDVPDRSGILIHAGNTTNDTEGCILVGHALGNRGILNSQAAMQELNAQLPSTFKLVIKELK